MLLRDVIVLLRRSVYCGEGAQNGETPTARAVVVGTTLRGIVKQHPLLPILHQQSAWESAARCCGSPDAALSATLTDRLLTGNAAVACYRRVHDRTLDCLPNEGSCVAAAVAATACILSTAQTDHVKFNEIALASQMLRMVSSEATEALE